MLKYTSMLIALCVLAISFPTAAQQSVECPAAPPTRLEQFTDAVITEGARQNMRVQPSLDAEIIEQLPAGTIVNILNDVECADGYLWWEIAYNGVIGYVAEGQDDEYWLEPYIDPEPVVVSEVDEDSITVTSDLLTFAFDPALAAEVTYQPRIGYMVRDAMSPHPNYASYLLHDYMLGDPTEAYVLRANVELYPVEAWETLNGSPIGHMTRLRELLETRPPLPIKGEAAPVLPYRNAAQFFVAQADYLEFEGGAGIRFVTFYAQNTVEIRGGLFYTFQGITDDGAYYISADFPLHVPTTVFPPYDEIQHIATMDDDSPLSDYYRDYIAQLTENLNALDPSEFAPDLTLLDALIESMQVNTDASIF